MLAMLLTVTLGQPAAPLETKVVKLRNAAAADVAELVGKPPAGVQFFVTPEPISNNLLVSAPPAEMVRILAVINKLDVAPQQYMIDLRVCSGDPLGSRAAGTLKVLSEPKIVVSEGAEGFVRAGGQAVLDVGGEPVSVGTEVKTRVLSRTDDLLKVRIEASHTTVEGPEKERSLKTVRSISTREVKAGETTRLRIGQPSDKLWVEVTVRGVQAMDPAKIAPYKGLGLVR